MSKEAWGRWGVDDEIGALNLIGVQQRQVAFSLVTEGRVISLAQPLDASTPSPSRRLGRGRFMDRDGGDYAAGAHQPSGFCFAEDTIIMPTHLGTHVDALCHVWYDDELYNGHSPFEIRSTTGAARCGVSTMPPIVTRGLLIDLVGEDQPGLAVGAPITADMLIQYCSLRDVTPDAGDAVLVRTGWAERIDELGGSYFDGEPGLDVSAGEWLAEQDVAVIGSDNYAVEVLPSQGGTVTPVHQRLIRDFGIPMVEGLLLAELAGSARTEFLFSCAVLPLHGATGSPVNPFALL